MNNYTDSWQPLKKVAFSRHGNYKREGSNQEVVSTAMYSTYDELNADAKSIIEAMTKLDNGKKWILVSAKIVGQSIDDEEKD